MLAAAPLSDRLALDVQGAQALRAGARAGDPAALRAAAKQFEALVVQTMLKTMRQTNFAGEGDVLGESSSLKLYRDMLDQQWAQKMVAGKGFGFAEMMVKAMESRSQALSPEAAARLAEAGGAAQEQGGAAAMADPGAPGAVKTGLPLPPRLSAAVAPQGRAEGPAQAVAKVGAVALARLPAQPDGAIETGALPEAALGRSGDYREQFLARLRPHAEQVAAETGVPARFILAHAALETGWGRHEIRKADGSASHNLFGIKAGRAWAGEVAEQATTEYQYGVPVRRVEAFRAYAGFTEAFRDYAGLLTRRYREAVQAGEDAAAFAQGLAAGGYATDPNYAGKLKGVIASLSGPGA
jgi:flagellar protein FlgJ